MCEELRLRVAAVQGHARDGLCDTGDSEAVRAWLRDLLAGHVANSGTLLSAEGFATGCAPMPAALGRNG